MSLVVDDLKSSMMNATANCETASDALIKLGNAINSYLLDNTEILFSWSAVLAVPPFTADPVVECNGGMSAINIVLTPSNVSDKTNSLLKLSTEIIAGVSVGLYNVTASGFSVTAMPLLPTPTLASLLINIVYDKDKDTRDEYFRQISDQIITWVKSFKPISPCSGSHGSYTGNATVINFY